MSFIKETEKYIYDVITKCGYEIDNVSFESSSTSDLAQIQINVSMAVANKFGINQR